MPKLQTRETWKEFRFGVKYKPQSREIFFTAKARNLREARGKMRKLLWGKEIHHVESYGFGY